MATSAAQPPPPTPNNGEQDPTPSRLNQEVQEQPNKGPKIMKRVAFKKLTNEEQLIQYFCSCPKLREKIVLSNILCHHTKIGDCIIHHFFFLKIRTVELKNISCVDTLKNSIRKTNIESLRSHAKKGLKRLDACKDVKNMYKELAIRILLNVNEEDDI